MATRSLIGRESSDGITFVYCHWDGYPAHVGKILSLHYDSIEKIDTLLAHGDVSQLGPSIGEKHDFATHNAIHPDWCLFYGRDRGDSHCHPKNAATRWAFRDYEADQQFYYLFAGGIWLFANRADGFEPVACELIEKGVL